MAARPKPELADLRPLEPGPLDRALSALRAAKSVLMQPDVQDWIETESEIETLTESDGIEPVDEGQSAPRDGGGDDGRRIP